MAASLVPMEGGSPIALDKPIMLIGRNQDCDISLQTSAKVSRRHCCIVQCGDRHIVRDLGSMNGVRVNDERVMEADLSEGDEIAVADVCFMFRRDEPPARQADRPPRQNARAKEAPSVQESERHDLSSAFPVAIPEPDEGDRPRAFHEEELLSDDDVVEVKDDSQSEAPFIKV